MLEAIGGLVAACNPLLCLIIGIRLMRDCRRSDAPEFWLACYFLLAPSFAHVLSSVIYWSWTSPSAPLSHQVVISLHMVSLLCATVGGGCLYLFTWLTFRRGSGGAMLLVGAAIATMATGLVGIGLNEGYHIQTMPGAEYWVAFVGRTAPLLWLTVESLSYWRLQRRRLRLGLADAVVSNRFLLLGGWALATFSTGQMDPIARFWYLATVGDTTSFVIERAHTIVIVMVAASWVLGILAAASLALAFFPPTRFRRWIAARAAARAST